MFTLRSSASVLLHSRFISFFGKKAADKYLLFNGNLRWDDFHRSVPFYLHREQSIRKYLPSKGDYGYINNINLDSNFSCSSLCFTGNSHLTNLWHMMFETLCHFQLYHGISSKSFGIMITLVISSIRLDQYDFIHIFLPLVSRYKAKLV